jgi:hypothetical protein
VTDGPAGETRLRRLREQLQAALRQLLPEPAPLPVFRLGHAFLYRDPMLRTERSLHRALDEAMFQTLRERTAESDRRVQGLEEIVAGGVVTLFQPILDLRDLTPVGHEVFSRGPAGGPFEDGERLFALAARFGRLLELERLCRRRSLRSAHRHLRRGSSCSSTPPPGRCSTRRSRARRSSARSRRKASITATWCSRSPAASRWRSAAATSASYAA